MPQSTRTLFTFHIRQLYAIRRWIHGPMVAVPSPFYWRFSTSRLIGILRKAGNSRYIFQVLTLQTSTSPCSIV